jgi:thioredoxin 1
MTMGSKIKKTDAELEEIRKKKLKELEEEYFGEPVEVTDKTFTQLIKANKAVVVDFWAEWCGPCRLMAPVVEGLAKKYSGKAVFGKLNVDENRATATKYKIDAIPTLLFFKNGEMVDQVVGFVPNQHLEQKIKGILG